MARTHEIQDTPGLGNPRTNASQLGADAAKPEHLVTESGIGYRFVP